MVNEKIEKQLLSNGVKPTSVRILVWKYFQDKTKASTLKELEDYFDYSDMSTLYRTLKTFVKHKILHTIDDGTGTLKYAKCIEGCLCKPEDFHFHFHCLNCKKTNCLIEVSIPTISLPKNYTLQEANMVVKGFCSNCN